MKKMLHVFSYMGGGMLAVILFLVLFVDPFTEVTLRLPLTVQNIVLFPFGILFFAAVCHLCYRIEKKKNPLSDKKVCHTVFVLSVVFFLLEVILCYQYYFQTGWDAYEMVRGAVGIVNGGDLTKLSEYLSRSPNNTLLVLVETAILWINKVLGVFQDDKGIMSLVVFQCILVTVTGILFYRILYRITGKTTPAFCGWVVYVIFLLTSPWTVVPYSDTVGLLFPIWILDLVLLETDQTKLSVLKWVFISGLTCAGYLIKPQLAITTVAAVIVCVCAAWGPDLFKTVRKKAPIWAAFVLSFLLFQYAMPRAARIVTPVTFYDVNNTPISYYIMMGLNTETNGGFYIEDALFSSQQLDPVVRTEENMRVAKERLQAMGVGGLLDHLLKKTLLNYGDGTFFWGREGSFYYEVPKEKNSTLSPLLRNIFYDTEEYGAYFDAWVLFRQASWLAVMLFAALGALYAKKDGANKAGIAIVFLALIGLTVFELMFEARSRYLYSYLPFYLIAAVLGWDVLAGKIKARRK